MNDTIHTFPVGTQVFGRVLNAGGEPIDKQGPLTGVQRVPLFSLASGTAQSEASKGKAPADKVLETGIKVIDLLAPIARGGVAGLFGNAGVGNVVVMEELIHNMIMQYNGYIVCLGMGESTYEVSELMDVKREGEFEDKVVIVFEQMTDEPEVRRKMIQAGLTIAGYARQEGHEALLVLDKNTTASGKLINMGELRRMLGERGITGILLGTEDDSKQFRVGDLPGELDSQIVLTRKMAEQSLWPAVDRHLSGSRLLNGGVVGSEHAQVAGQVRELLRRCAELETREPQGLSDADKQLFRRAQRIQKFFTQPFFVAEAYTDIPGEYVKMDETVKGFKELLEGRYDDLPEQAFYFVGDIDEAVAKGS